MQLITILKLIISLLPLLIDAIKAIEAAMPGTGKGATKLAAVQSIVESAYKASSDALPPFEDIVPVLQKTVESIIAGFNVTGVFAKTTA